MTILPAHISDTEVEGVSGALTKLIEKEGGEVKKLQNLGKIKLAYAIKRQRHGIYLLFYVEIGGEKMKKLDQNFRLAEEVVRHMIVARPEGIPAGSFTLVSYTPPLTPEGRRANERDDRPAQKSAEKSGEKAPVTEEIAGKLDAILESDIMKNV